MLEMTHVTCSVARNAEAVYELLWHPTSFSKWASGMGEGGVQPNGGEWIAMGPEGPLRLSFTGHNPFGVMDHSVHLDDGSTIYVPMRILANGQGCTVLFTLFRQPEDSPEKFAADADWVRKDLHALKAFAEASLAE